MAHRSERKAGAIAAPAQQELPSTTDPLPERSPGTRVLLLPVDDTDVSLITWQA